jgi:hypothetical protein
MFVLIIVKLYTYGDLWGINPVCFMCKPRVVKCIKINKNNAKINYLKVNKI